MQALAAGMATIAPTGLGGRPRRGRQEKINHNRASYQTIRADSRYASLGHE